jgi:hypothetical protein
MVYTPTERIYMLLMNKDVYGLHSSIPAVYEDRNFDKGDIESAKLIGYTEDDHVVIQLEDESITVVYSIDIDWAEYDPETDKVSA